MAAQVHTFATPDPISGTAPEARALTIQLEGLDGDRPTISATYVRGTVIGGSFVKLEADVTKASVDAAAFGVQAEVEALARALLRALEAGAELAPAVDPGP